MIKQFLSLNKDWLDIIYKLTPEISNTSDKIDEFVKIYGDNMLRPSINDIFNAFRGINVSDVKGIMIGQSPYPGSCSVTNTNYADGVLFDIPDNVLVKPLSYKIVESNILKDFKSIPNNRMRFFKDDMKFLMINASMTIGVSNDEYANNHEILWRHIISTIVSRLSKNGIIIITFGTVAEHILSSEHIDESSIMIKFKHPAARIDTDPFEGRSLIREIELAATRLSDVNILRYISAHCKSYGKPI